MQKDALNNVHITDEQVLITPDQLKAAFPLSAAQEAQIEHSRQTISDIIAGRDPRLLVVCGPCSIHDPETAIEYADIHCFIFYGVQKYAFFLFLANILSTKY